MSKHWKEILNPEIHKDFMSTSHIGGLEATPRNKMVQEWIYFVRECSFTFQFRTLNQLDGMIDYFKLKIHPSSMKPDIHLEHYWQSWQERLPGGITKDTKRLKILKALEKAKVDWQQPNLQ